jgi:cytidine kinase
MQCDERPRDAALRRAMAYGTVLASFNVEEFGTERVARLSEQEVSERYQRLRAMTHFDLEDFHLK